MCRHVALLALLFVAPARADTVVWFNGDARTAFPTGEYTATNGAMGPVFAYDDFDFAAATTVSRVFGQFYALTNPGVAQAAWEIRSGVSAGNGGTLVAGGTSAATAAALGSSPLGKYGLYQVEVPNLSVTLAPGTYWLALAPTIGTGGSPPQSTFAAFTDGTNAVGTPAGDNGNSFVTGTAIAANFSPFNQIGNRDLSYGVAADPGSGTGSSPGGGSPAPLDPIAAAVPTPEPGTLAVAGLLGLAAAARRYPRRSSSAKS